MAERSLPCPQNPPDVMVKSRQMSLTPNLTYWLARDRYIAMAFYRQLAMDNPEKEYLCGLCAQLFEKWHSVVL